MLVHATIRVIGIGGDENSDKQIVNAMCPQDRDNMTRIRVAGEKHTAVVSRSVVNAFYSKHITLCCKQRTLHKTKKTYEVRSCICFTPHPRHILHTGCPGISTYKIIEDSKVGGAS